MEAARKHWEVPRIGVIGLGHVGLATGIAFAARGLEVHGYDVDARRRSTVDQGKTPWFEPGLPEILRRQVDAGRLSVASSVSEVVDHTNLLFICVPTPSRRSGGIDLTYIRRSAVAIGDALGTSDHWVSVVLKSTALPGTTDTLLAPTLRKRSGLWPDRDFGVGANPEFLAEGSMVADALHPFRIILGVRDRRTGRLLRRAYAKFQCPVVELTPAGAELAKYASNAMLATRVSFTNEFARLAELVGADIYRVMEAVGLDPRIGPLFLRAGPGFGGSCFTKDLSALIRYGRQRSLPLEIPAAVLSVNRTQPIRLVDAVESELGLLRGKRIALLGLSFKAGSDDTAESRAYPIFTELTRRGAVPVLYDPRATENFLRGLPRPRTGKPGPRFQVARSPGAALSRAAACILQTDWPEFRRLPLRLWMRLGDRLVVDARRSVDPVRLVRSGIRYRAIGRPTP
jgi:UDPglucose 6-dehydrogenase